MKEVTVKCDDCGEPVNAEYLELVVRSERIKPPDPTWKAMNNIIDCGPSQIATEQHDEHFDLCGVLHVHPKLDSYYNRVISGELDSVKVSIARKFRPKGLQ